MKKQYGPRDEGPQDRMIANVFGFALGIFLLLLYLFN